MHGRQIKMKKQQQPCCRNRSTLFKRKRNEKESKTKKKGSNEGTNEGIKNKKGKRKERKSRNRKKAEFCLKATTNSGRQKGPLHKNKTTENERWAAPGPEEKCGVRLGRPEWGPGQAEFLRDGPIRGRGRTGQRNPRKRQTLKEIAQRFTKEARYKEGRKEGRDGGRKRKLVQKKTRKWRRNGKRNAAKKSKIQGRKEGRYKEGRKRNFVWKKTRKRHEKSKRNGAGIEEERSEFFFPPKKSAVWKPR